MTLSDMYTESKLGTLTARQASVLEFIINHIADLGRPPSVREICERFDIASPNGIIVHIEALERKGFIQVDAQRSRGIRVKGFTWQPMAVVASEAPAAVGHADVITNTAF